VLKKDARAEPLFKNASDTASIWNG